MTDFWHALDWLEEAGIDGWTSADTVRLAGLLAERGVDLLDVSSGGNWAAQRIASRPGYQVRFAATLKVAVPGRAACAVGAIKEPKPAVEILQKCRFFASELIRRAN